MSGYRHIYLSPHLDDVVLSCGGRIHQLVQAGELVLVITVFAGSPRFGDAGGNRVHSNYVAALHQRWGAGADAPALRRAEDGAAMRALGADFRYLPYLDCIYRQHPVTGEFFYQSDEDIFAGVHLAEFCLVAELRERLEELIGAPGEATIYSPLAAGHHLDHQIVAAAALALQADGHRAAFYEDYPYAEIPSELTAARRRVGGGSWREELLALSSEDLRAKTAAVLHYQSQLSTFFQDEEEVSRRLYVYASTVRPGAQGEAPALQSSPCERIWHLTK